MDERLNDIEARHDDLKQYTRKFNLVIHGIREHEEEDNVASVVTLGKLLQVNLTPGDIDIVHRINTKSKDKSRSIITRFSNYNARSKLQKAVKNTNKQQQRIMNNRDPIIQPPTPRLERVSCNNENLLASH